MHGFLLGVALNHAVLDIGIEIRERNVYCIAQIPYWIVVKTIGFACEIVIHEQAPRIVVLVGVGEGDARTHLERRTGINREEIPRGRIFLTCIANSHVYLLKIVRDSKIHFLLVARELGIEVEFLHHAAPKEQFAAESKTGRKRNVEIASKVEGELCEVVALNVQLVIGNQVAKSLIIILTKFLEHIAKVAVGLVE